MSKVGFWLKGSTGKLAGTTLYKGANGETIQREIVSPSNPKTMAQNIQRIVMSTVGAAYSVMKAICDHSFEGVKKGQETMSLFMSENIQKSRAAIEEMQWLHSSLSRVRRVTHGSVRPPTSHILARLQMPTACSSAST